MTTLLNINQIKLIPSRKAYVQRMGEQTEKMQENMRESMKMMKDVADKNNEFMEKSLKMAQEQRKEQQQQMVEMVEAFQEKNAQIAKGICCVLIYSRIC